MKWYTFYILAYICVLFFVYIGVDMLPHEGPIYNKYMNLSQNGTVIRQGIETMGFNFGNDTSGEIGPQTEEFMTVNKTAWQSLLELDIGGAASIAAENLAAFLGGAADHVIGAFGFLDAIGQQVSGPWVVLVMIGIPQPYAGGLGAIFSILFLFALYALFIGRDI